MASELRLRRLHDAVADINHSLDLEHRVRAAVTHARHLESADAAAVFLADQESGTLSIRAHEGLSDDYAARLRLPLAGMKAAFRGPDTHEVIDLRARGLGDPGLIRVEGLAKALSLPLMFEGELLGALNVYTKDPSRTFDPDDVEVAHILAGATAVAVVNSRLYSEAVEQRELLRESDKDREQFLSIVSHELRTPLTPLKAMAQLIRARVKRHRTQGASLDLDSLERNLAAIERQVDRMNGLVNDLLSVSRAERGILTMERAPFDLAAVTREVVQRYVAATAEEGRHSFVLDVPESLATVGDQARVEQLLMNLIGNAVKYSPYGGEIRVSVSASDGTANVTIADRGIGIPPEEISQLGHPFVRGAGRAGTFAGMGVGLYVARLVAEGHGGTLALESEGNEKGTTVRVALPI